mmetsp:Transcript_55098/g.159997  ORF Transcript_55098/g.159997 Transcript_55098/m.159997 type:complete len:166 (+) Transcript_55098:217-714(+)
MQKGLGEYKGVFMVTIFEGAHITTACLSGCVVLEEMGDSTWPMFLCYWAAVGLIIAGILLINTASAESKLAGATRSTRSFLMSQSSTSSMLSFASGDFLVGALAGHPRRGAPGCGAARAASLNGTTRELDCSLEPQASALNTNGHDLGCAGARDQRPGPQRFATG